MNTLLVVLFLGCFIGLFIGSRTLHSEPPQITVVQVEPPVRRQGCLPVLIGLVIALFALWVIASSL